MIVIVIAFEIIFFGTINIFYHYHHFIVFVDGDALAVFSLLAFCYSYFTLEIFCYETYDEPQSHVDYTQVTCCYSVQEYFEMSEKCGQDVFVHTSAVEVLQYKTTTSQQHFDKATILNLRRRHEERSSRPLSEPRAERHQRVQHTRVHTYVRRNIHVYTQAEAHRTNVFTHKFVNTLSSCG